MPIEIRELVIKATVVTDAQAATQAGTGIGAPSGAAEMVQTCVEKVLQILKEKNER